MRSASDTIAPSRSDFGFERDAGWQVGRVHRHRIIAEAARWAVIAGPRHCHTFEQRVGRGVAKIAVMLEHNEAARIHLAPRGGPVMVEHIGQCLPHQRKISLGKAGPLLRIIGQAAGDEAMGAIQAIGNEVFAAHGTIVLQRIRNSVKPKHYQIFDAYVVKGWSVEKVSATLNVTPDLVYQVKSRLTAAIQKETSRLEASGI